MWARPFFGHGMDQVNRLACIQRFLNILMGCGDDASQKGKEIQIVGAVAVGNMLVRWDQGRDFQKQFRLNPKRGDLSAVGNMKGFDVTAMSTE